jgi:hypothetical protein
MTVRKDRADILRRHAPEIVFQGNGPFMVVSTNHPLDPRQSIAGSWAQAWGEGEYDWRFPCRGSPPADLWGLSVVDTPCRPRSLRCSGLHPLLRPVHGAAFGRQCGRMGPATAAPREGSDL